MTNAEIKKRIEILEKMSGEISDAVSDMQEKFDAKSEKWQESDSGDAAQAKIDAIESAMSNLDCAISDLQEIIES